MPIFSPTDSKVKVIIYFQDGGNARFYSVLKKDHKPWETIANTMTRRILNRKYQFNFKLAIYYDNQTNKEFKRVHGTHYSPPSTTPDYFDPEKSIIKATLITMDHKAKVYYSRLSEEKKYGNDPIEIRNAMRKRLNDKYENRSLTFESRPQ